MDVVGVMAAYLPIVCVCVCVRVCPAQSREAVYTRATGKYAAITPTTSMSTDKIEPLLQF